MSEDAGSAAAAEEVQVAMSEAKESVTQGSEVKESGTSEEVVVPVASEATATAGDAAAEGEPAKVEDAVAAGVADEPAAAVAASGVVTEIADLSAVSGADMAAKLAWLKANHDVLIISKSFCPFCLEVKRTFASLGVPVAVVEVNVVKDGGALRKVVIGEHPTVPVVFIKGALIGGCDEVKSLQATGELEQLTKGLSGKKAAANATSVEGITTAPVERGRAIQTLFWFPPVVNNHVIQLVGVQIVALCILAIVYRDDLWGRWLVAFMLFDYTSRFLAGSGASLIGMIATVAVAPFTPSFKPGPPKQFAASCGLVFTLIATALYFTDNEVAGAVVIGLLMGCAALEGFANFCVGCLFFGWGVRFGLVPAEVYHIFTNVRQETIDAWQYVNGDSGAAHPEPFTEDTSNPAALAYKARTDEWTKQDFHPVRNMQISYFSVPMSIAGLAVAFKVAGSWLSDWASSVNPLLNLQLVSAGVEFRVSSLNVSTAWYQSIGLAGAVIFWMLFILYAMRLGLYPRKCLKEWQSPMLSGGFGTFTISLMLFAFLTFDSTDNSMFARAIFWLGAVTHMTLTVVKMGEWLGRRLEPEHVDSSWMILPVGNLVAALVAPVVPALQPDAVIPASTLSGQSVFLFGSNTSSLEIAQFFFSIGFLMWLVLFTVTFFLVSTTHNSDERRRTLAAIWVAAPAVAGLAHFVIGFSKANFNDLPNIVSDFTRLYFIAIVLALALAWASVPYLGFFGRQTFDMSYWNFCFPLDALAAAAAVYYGVSGFDIARALLVIFLVLASVANGVAFLHVLAKLIRRRGVFTPMKKWGPLAFMKLTHDALRGALPHLVAALNAMDLNDRDSIELFALRFKQLAIMHGEHSKHEDEVVFKNFSDFFPKHLATFAHDHHDDHIKFLEWTTNVNALLANDADTDADELAAVVTKLKQEIPAFVEHLLAHLQGEEDHANPVGKRYVPIAMQIQLSRQVFALTPASSWEVIMPYIVNNLPRHQQRVIYIRALCWAMPERAQQFGAIIYRNCDAVMWERLRIETPEIVPRGLFNWWRYY